MVFNQLKKIIVLIITFIPINNLKITFLNFFKGFDIDKKSSIGFCVIINTRNLKITESKINSFNLINVKNIRLTKSNIGNFNIFNNFEKLVINDSKIMDKNKFYGLKFTNEKTSLVLNNKTFIENNNYFDLTGSIKINNAKVENFCQIWTHGFDSLRNIKIGDVNIAENCIIKSNSIINYNVTIVKDTIVGLGSVVAKSILVGGIYESSEILKKK